MITNQFNKLLSDSLLVLFIKIIGLAASIIISIYISRKLGAEGLGVFNLVNKILNILIVFSTFGLYQTIRKYIALTKEKLSNDKIEDIIFSTTVFTFFLSLFLGLIGYSLIPLFVNYFDFDENLNIIFLIMFYSLIPMTLTRIYSAALNGMEMIWQSQIVDLSLSQIFIIIGIVVLNLFNFDINVINIWKVYAISRTIIFLSVFIFWKKKFKKTINPVFRIRKYIKMGSYMTIITSVYVINSNIDAIILGFYNNFSDVGIYSVCLRLSQMCLFILAALNASIGPKIAKLYVSNKSELKIIVTKTTKALSIISFCFFITIFFLGKIFLGFWGENFIDGYNILLILSLAFCIYVSFGVNGLLLSLTGHERIYAIVSILFLVLGLLFNIILIRNFGSIGAAIATFLVVIIQTLTCNYLVLKYVKIKMIE